MDSITGEMIKYDYELLTEEMIYLFNVHEYSMFLLHNCRNVVIVLLYKQKCSKSECKKQNKNLCRGRDFSILVKLICEILTESVWNKKEQKLGSHDSVIPGRGCIVQNFCFQQVITVYEFVKVHSIFYWWKIMRR